MRRPLLALWLILAQAGPAAAAAPTGQPYVVSGAAARRLLRTYGYKGALTPEGIRRPDGSVRSLDAGIPYEELFALTQSLSRRGGNGLMGLSPRSPHVQRLERNLRKWGADGAEHAPISTVLRRGDLIEGHHVAAEALASDAPLAEKLTPLGRVYTTAGISDVARFVARKLERVDEVGAAALTAQLDAQEGRLDRSTERLRRLARQYPDDPRLWRVHAKLLGLFGDRPSTMVRYAERAYLLDPRDLENQLTLGNTYLFAARRNHNTDENMAKGLEILRRVRRRDDDIVIPQEFLLPRWSRLAQTTAILKRATRALDADDLDQAERIAKSALEVDSRASRAYGFVNDVRTLRLLRSRAQLAGEPMLSSDIRTRERQHALGQRALALGIETLVPKYRELTTLQRAVVARALLPIAKLWPRMVAIGESAVLVPPWQSPLDLNENVDLAEKTPDHRYFYGVRGTSSLTLYTGTELLDQGAYGDLDTFGHEVGHHMEWALPRKDVRRITRLFRRGIALDDYAASDQHEYFAVGYEAFLSERKSPTATKYSRHTRAELKEKDPALYRLFLDFTRRKWPKKG